MIFRKLGQMFLKFGYRKNVFKRFLAKVDPADDVEEGIIELEVLPY